jgi:hypothetical protein
MGRHGLGTRVRVRRRLKSGEWQERIRVVVTMPDGRRVSKIARDEGEADELQGKLVEARRLGLDPTRQTVAPTSAAGSQLSVRRAVGDSAIAR